MDSFLSGYSRGYTGSAGGYTGGIAGAGTAGSGAAGGQNADVTQLKAGDIFQGEITSVNGEDVQIQLVNGQYLTAKLERDVQVALGQILNLQVQSNKDNRVVLKPVYDSGTQMIRVGEAALRAANMAVNEKNLQLVAKLIENGMSIDKNTLMTHNRLALQNPKVSLSNIIELNKLQMPITEDNARQLQNYHNLGHKILDGVREASNELVQTYDSIVRQGAHEGAALPGNPAAHANAAKFMEQALALLTQEDMPEGTVSAKPEQNAAVINPENSRNGENTKMLTSKENNGTIGNNKGSDAYVINENNKESVEKPQESMHPETKQPIGKNMANIVNENVKDVPALKQAQTADGGTALESTSKDTAPESTDKGIAAENTGKDIVTENTGKGIASENTGKDIVTENTGKDVVTESTGKGIVAESAGKGIVAESTGRDAIKEFISQLKAEMPENVPDKVIQYIIGGKAELKDIKQLLTNTDIGKNLPAEQKTKIFSSEPFKSLLKDGMQKRWSITPGEISREGKVEEFYNKLLKESNQFKKLMNEAMQSANAHAANAPASKAMGNIAENVEFINHMNQLFNYVQLPLKLGDSKAHGDLYVYTNKKNMARKDGMLTAFLHLDMDHLGSLDVSIALQTQRSQVTTKFYLDEDSTALIKEHIGELSARLEKKGYTCKNMILEKEEDKTVLEHIEEQVAAGSAVIGYRTFDTRA